MTRKLASAWPLAVLALAIPITTRAADGECDPEVRDVYAGQTEWVGTLTVSDDGEEICAVYEIDPDWWMTETHLYIGTMPPLKAAPGKFPYKSSGLLGNEVSYCVPIADLGISPGDDVAVAAHAVVETLLYYEADWDAFLASLPTDPVSIEVHWPGGDSYIDTSIYDPDIGGMYNGWCVDVGTAITPDVVYDNVLVISSYAAEAADLVDQPENLDLVNWLLNQPWVGETSTACGGDYTYGDVQRAIWELIDDHQSTVGLGSWSQCRSDEIVAAALADGEGFVPGCDEGVAVLLRPVEVDETTGAVTTVAQITLVLLPPVCEPVTEEETAWAEGDTSFMTGWGSWFWYETCDDEPEPPTPRLVPGWTLRHPPLIRF